MTGSRQTAETPAATPVGTQHTLRLADGDTARRNPLPVSTSARFEPRPGGFIVEMPVPPMDAGELLVPSFSTTDTIDGFRFVLVRDGRGTPLNPVGNDPAIPTAPAVPGLATHIDCYTTHSPQPESKLRLYVGANAPPERYLITCSRRALASPAGSPCGQTRYNGAPALSQMELDPRIRQRTCSPVGLAMALRHLGHTLDLERFVADCLDPTTNMYGVWPRNLLAASRLGAIGSIELFSGWNDAYAVLDAGVPLVTSIRFGNGGLPGAPLAATGGHLVVLCGIEGGSARVCDPAAPDHGSVRRRYPADAFARAWLAHRGAAYVVCPPGNPISGRVPH